MTEPLCPPRCLAALLILALAAAPGCASDGPVTTNDPGSMGAFDPAAMRIYPLTHVERAALSAGGESAAGPTRVICHIEFTDRWDDTVKALGKLEISLYRPGGGLNPGVDVHQAKWDLDLTDLRKNVEWFDPVTRTYRVQLDLPGWAQADPGTPLRLRAIFTPAGTRGIEGALHDDFTIRM